jgi:uncharacterized BrkB/YihY/UPF0761 family membrane protein
MMRDYKIQQAEWPLRKNRRSMMKTILMILGILVLASAGYTGYQWLVSLPKENAPQVDANSRIIPLQLPPNRASATE